MKYTIAILLLIIISSISNALENNDIAIIVDKIQQKYEKIDDFHAKFIQEATVKVLNKVEKADGEVWFKKPGKMRWNYYKPTKDQIVFDGSKIWFYDPEENQVIESNISSVADPSSSTTLFSGLGKIKELFDTTFSTNGKLNEKDNFLLDLKPKNDGGEFNKVTIAVDKESLLLKTFLLYDPYGNITKVSLEDIKINKGINNDIFNFVKPEGVEVITPPY